MELIKVGEKTYYIKNNTNIGIYTIDENKVYIIDTGNNKEAGRKILKIINDQGWAIEGIISTHSHADHIGGNKFIQDRTNCKILSHNLENSFINYPILESSYLYGANPFQDLQNKFLKAQESQSIEIEGNLPSGLKLIDLKGHSFDMIGIRTSDNVYFLADSIFSEETINKYHISFIQNIKSFLTTLDFLETLNGKLYIASHIEETKDIKPLIKINRNKVYEISNKIIEYCNTPHTFEEILTNLFNEYNLNMNSNQYVLIGSTLKSYLTYLLEENKISYEFKDNKMIWFTI